MPDSLPSAPSVILPSRAFLLSWREQTLPARTAALEDALALFDEADRGEDAGLRDLALLGVIGDAMQPLEDLATLGDTWDRPLRGLANYVRAITWDRYATTNFWQEITRWEDERLAVFSGLAARDPDTQAISSIPDTIGITERFTDGQRHIIEIVYAKTVKRLRQEMRMLAANWKQFSTYFLAYKHGGLAVPREGVSVVDDDVQEITDDTTRHEFALAVWTRGKRNAVNADCEVTARQIADAAAASARQAIELIGAFLETRLAIFDAAQLDATGEVIGVESFKLPWTIWLREEDLSQEQWRLIGYGPRINWVNRAEPSGPA